MDHGGTRYRRYRGALSERLPIITFDEIHRYGRWRNWLKGFFYMRADQCRVVVTGSSRLDVFRRGGDSLMAHYFHYRMHPLSVAELPDPNLPGETLLRPPRHLPEAEWQALYEHDGFPETFFSVNSPFPAAGETPALSNSCVKTSAI